MFEKIINKFRKKNNTRVPVQDGVKRVEVSRAKVERAKVPGFRYRDNETGEVFFVARDDMDAFDKMMTCGHSVTIL